MVKRLAQIGSRVLAVYFIVLPILFGIHADQHQHPLAHEHDSELAITTQSTDCTICDLYHGQTAILQEQELFLTAQVFTPYASTLTEALLGHTLPSLYLRGPPTA